MLNRVVIKAEGVLRFLLQINSDRGVAMLLAWLLSRVIKACPLLNGGCEDIVSVVKTAAVLQLLLAGQFSARVREYVDCGLDCVCYRVVITMEGVL